MIPLIRKRKRSVIDDNFVNPKREKFNIELMKHRRKHLRDLSIDQEFKSYRWKPAKKQLLDETNGKCAYCEAPTSVVAYGDVEHYRPKSKYWWLAYCYENYLPSCQLCNQIYKSAKFPVKNTRMISPVKIRSNSTDDFIDSKAGDLTPDTLDNTAVLDFEEMHLSEWPYIINPYIEDPAHWVAWKENDVTERVKVVPSSNSETAKKVIKALEDDLGLNRIELQDLRYKQFLLFRAFKRALRDPNLSYGTRQEAESSVERMLDDSAQFAGMMRYFDTRL